MKRTPPNDGVRTRHLPVLEAVDGAGNVSQRSLAEQLGMAASGVNRLIRDLLEAGLLEVVDEAVRPFAYRLTGEGNRHLRRLSHEHFRAVLEDFRAMQGKISRRLRGIRDGGFRRLVFYGAGEVMEVTLPLAEELGLVVVGVVDDDPEKVGSRRGGMRVLSPDGLEGLDADAIVISTYRHAEEIRQRLGLNAASRAHILQL